MEKKSYHIRNSLISYYIINGIKNKLNDFDIKKINLGDLQEIIESENIGIPAKELLEYISIDDLGRVITVDGYGLDPSADVLSKLVVDLFEVSYVEKTYDDIEDGIDSKNHVILSLLVEFRVVQDTYDSLRAKLTSLIFSDEYTIASVKELISKADNVVQKYVSIPNIGGY